MYTRDCSINQIEHFSYAHLVRLNINLLSIPLVHHNLRLMAYYPLI